MGVTLEQINREIKSLRSDVERIKELLEERELSESARSAILASRRRSPEEFVSRADIEKKFL